MAWFGFKLSKPKSPEKQTASLLVSQKNSYQSPRIAIGAGNHWNLCTWSLTILAMVDDLQISSKPSGNLLTNMKAKAKAL